MKSPTNFWEIADIWYQRSHRLREVWQSATETERKVKAFSLWLIMFNRMMAIVDQSIIISQSAPPKQYVSGGINFGVKN